MKKRQQLQFIWSFLAAPLGLYVLFVLIPTVNAFRYSLTRWDGLSEPVWVGFKNFKAFLGHNSDFIPAVKHNLFLMFAPGVIILVLALSFANLIHQRIKGARLFRVSPRLASLG